MITKNLSKIVNFLSKAGRKKPFIYSIVLVYLPNWSRNTVLKIIIFSNFKNIFLSVFKNNFYIIKSRVSLKLQPFKMFYVKDH